MTTIHLSFHGLKQIALTGRVEKDGVMLVVGRPLIPDLTTDASGLSGEVRFTVDERELTCPGLRSSA